MKILSQTTHTIIGLVVGFALIVAPWLFGFAEAGGAAVMVPVVVGIMVLLSELTTTSPISPLKVVPMRIHIMMDVVLGVFLALSPWLFGFANLAANAWVPHVIVGLAMAGYALITNPQEAGVKALHR